MAGGAVVFVRLIVVLVSLSLSSALAFAESNGAQSGPDAAKKASPAAPQQSSTGAAQIYVYWPKDAAGFFASFLPDMEVWVDGKKTGTMISGDYITAQVSTGKHVIAFKAGILSLPMTRNNIAIGAANTKHYYRIIRVYESSDPKSGRLVTEEVSEARAIQELKGLRKR
jgi:hypothetical protein